MTFLALFLLIALLVKHYVADIVLQTNWMALNKGTWLHPGGLVHAALHGLGTLLVLGLLQPFTQQSWLSLGLLVVLETIVHYLIDYTKMNLDRRTQWSQLVTTNGQVTGRLITSKFYYWALVGDQCLHFATYLLIGYLVTS
jgi:hypothetical protein